MNPFRRCLLSLLVLIILAVGLPAAGRAALACGDILLESTTLTEDLLCPPGTSAALEIGASNITLDLGGHTISGHVPGTGIMSVGREDLTIRNGVISGFTDGVFLINNNRVTLEDLTVRNMDISDPGQFIFGIHIIGSRAVVVRDSLFRFLTVPHKEAVEIYDSEVDVSNIDVRGGGAGVSFSFAGGSCDPLNHPSNGTVTRSTFTDIYVAGIWVACSSRALIENNHFSGAADSGIGIQADAPTSGAVTGLTVRGNSFQDAQIGVELRGIQRSTISHNQVFGNQIWGITVRQSLGCLTPEPGWECFFSTGNTIADNETWENGADLYHCADCTGNTWERNTCQWADGAEIPACTSPNPALTVNYPVGRPGSFFSVEGANFPPAALETITANEAVLGTIQTGPSGDLFFILDTSQSDPGAYTLMAAGKPSSAAGFFLGLGASLRLQEGAGTLLSLPGGLAVGEVYLPLTLR